MRSTTPGFARLYYEAGPVVKEAESARLPIEGGNREVDYRFPLPEGRFKNLRFDPTDQRGDTVVLSRLRIVHRSGRLLRTIQSNQVKASRESDQVKTTATDVTIRTLSTDPAPIMTLELGEPLVLVNFSRASWTTLLRRFLLSFPVATGLWLLFTPAFRLAKIRAGAVGWSAALRSWSSEHPEQAVLVIAALFAILSCYPVAFFGKSFLSPNNHSHTVLLYNEMPTVPDSRDGVVDDEKGSDMGAAMWYSWPNSVIQSRALRKDFELPLWNRYDSTGVPLLGQGQSMFGDPLHLLVLLTNGLSGGWDLKYVLAKFLFAACLGLSVLQAARHFPAALLIAATAPFIGFFPYRYSHPAFFSLCYAPSILLCWFKLTDSRPGKATAFWLGAMVLANWTVMNSGTVKEAYLLLLALNACGFLTLLLGQSIAGGKRMKLLQALFANVLFLAIGMPIWFTFLQTLQNSFTVYDAGGAWQIPPPLLIGLFDNIFYRQFNLDQAHLDPSLNFLTLLAVLWFVASPRRADPRGVARGLATTSLVALAFVFAVVPPTWITRLPFLKNILHIDNTFSCIAIVCLLVLAGFGIKTFWNDCRAADFKRTYFHVMAIFAGLIALYLGTTEAVMRSGISTLHAPLTKSNFFWGYSFSLVVAVALLPWLGRFMLLTGRLRIFPVISLIFLFVLLHWRSGMHLMTPFDSYVMNPHSRANLTADSSPALQLVKAHTTEPSRSVGWALEFFPGYGGAVDVEQIDGPHPLINKHYRALLDSSGLRLQFGTSQVGVVKDRLSLAPVLLNMLNVRYYLGYAGPNAAIPSSLRKIASLDLDVYESEHVWPRAFFSDGLVPYETNTEFVELLKSGDGAPFAAVPDEELRNRKELAEFAGNSTSVPTHQAIPARDYAFTNNTTSFKVTAPGPGVVVLTEAFLEGDFRARLNGEPADYFRINSAFKGLFVPEAGEYAVSYTYWPRYLTLSLLTAAGGVAALVCWLAFMAWGGLRRPL